MARRKRMTPRVLRLLLRADLDAVRAKKIAARLYVSPSTLRRRLRSEGTSYQELLDRVRCRRCEKALSSRWLPGKSIADELGYSQPNSFYRAFGKWTGMTYTEFRRVHKSNGSVAGASGIYWGNHRQGE
jgi:AraC-like DNA-binding protein